ncbi:MAG TPA: hypothetical protein VGP47_05565 [Parachlamydiaceae bacterium]|nr:hypothetical protein [Parachlamydiaceae bacterium]
MITDKLKKNNYSMPAQQSHIRSVALNRIHDNACDLFNLAMDELDNNNKKASDKFFIEALKLFIKAREFGNNQKHITAENYFCCGYIYYRFNYHLNALANLELAAQLNPYKDSYNYYLGFIENKMLNMSARERLEWIDKTLDIENVGIFSDIDLLLCKIEAHFQIGESEKGVESAKSLLKILNESHPAYKQLEFKIANPQFLAFK